MTEAEDRQDRMGMDWKEALAIEDQAHNQKDKRKWGKNKIIHARNCQRTNLINNCKEDSHEVYLHD